MRSKEIGHINEALLVLRHFIDLSAKLLPFLDEINRKKNPTYKELLDRSKIISVYENYEFDTKTSRVLLNSDVLDLIKDSFEQLVEPRERRSNRGSQKLRKFLLEHYRLKKCWYHIEAN